MTTIHTLIGSELLDFIATLKPDQHITNLIHKTNAHYTAYVIQPDQPELFQANQPETIHRVDRNHKSATLG